MQLLSAHPFDAFDQPRADVPLMGGEAHDLTLGWDVEFERLRPQADRGADGLQRAHQFLGGGGKVCVVALHGRGSDQERLGQALLNRAAGGQGPGGFSEPANRLQDRFGRVIGGGRGKLRLLDRSSGAEGHDKRDLVGGGGMGRHSRR